jgi:ribonuclease-3
MIRKFRAYFRKRSLDASSREKIIYLEKLMGEPINSPHYFLRALRHRSKLIEDGLDDVESYEQLEFLGDAVLDLVITEILFERFPDNNEGFMTKLRSRLVKEATLAELSRALGFPDLVEVGNRVKGQGIELKNSVLCDIFESVIGAIYRDAGIKAAQKFIRNAYNAHIDIDNMSVTQDNYKSLLLEFTQAYKLSVPDYVILSETGPDHDKTFSIEVRINDVSRGDGKAKNKKNAEQQAARKALQSLKEELKSGTL